MFGYLLFALLIMVQAVAGGWLARNRGRNMLLWGALSSLFPIFIMIIYFEKPLREVPGGFRRCPACGEFITWQSGHCKYCAAPVSSPPGI
jgi:hypothetical protein